MTHSESMRKKKTSGSETLLLERYAPVADGIAALFAGYVEVVIHDYASQKVVHIANNLSKRSLGDDSALDDIAPEEPETVIGPYEKIGWDGGKQRSISIVLRDDDGHTIGLLCINMKLDVFEQAKQAFDIILSHPQLVPQPDKLFQDDWQERINTFIHHWLTRQGLTMARLSHPQKRALVTDLYNNGAFKGKSSQNYVANVLNMGRATVFKYLRELKETENA